MLQSTQEMKNKFISIKDLRPGMRVRSEGLRARFYVVSLQENKVYLKDVTKYAEGQKSGPYSAREIDDNFFRISICGNLETHKRLEKRLKKV